jgi:phage tail-like protein
MSHRSRSFNEPGGGFGGLVLPTNAALTPEGDLYLLDPRAPGLKIFDPCECIFKPIPCFSDPDAGPRKLSDPHGIGICGDALFICDTGSHRLLTYSLDWMSLRGQWSPPAGLANPWEPYDVAFDVRRRVYVSDRANGLIHRFTAGGRWEVSFPGFSGVTHLCVDAGSTVYASIGEPPEAVYVLGIDGAPRPVTDSPESLASSFPLLPFAIDKEGLLHLESLCAAANGGAARRGVFDPFGEPVTDPETLEPPDFAQNGEYVSRALDSELYRCRWHRIIVHASIPAGSRIRVSTCSAEAMLTREELANLAPRQWQSPSTAISTADSPWDCLVRSPQGRYLWLKLELSGNGRVTPEVRAVEVEYPRISLRRYLPSVFGAEPVSADFTDRFLAVFDATLRGMEDRIDTLARFFDPMSTPSTPLVKGGTDFLSWLGTWIGLALDTRWPESKRRRFLKKAGGLFPLRGTPKGLWRQLLFYLGMDARPACRADASPNTCATVNRNCAPVTDAPCAYTPPPLILEHFRLRRWMFLGAGRLSEQALLWGKSIVNRSQLDENARLDSTRLIGAQDPYRDPFHVYAHKMSVFVPACAGATDRDRKSLETLLKAESPAHARCFVHYVEPRFRVGIQAAIGLDSVVAGTPRGAPLSKASLGKNVVLNGPRVGTTILIG